MRKTDAASSKIKCKFYEEVYRQSDSCHVIVSLSKTRFMVGLLHVFNPYKDV
jgi:hypothetical protein